MSVSWYDVLGVEPDAPADEIRTAWQNASAQVDPAKGAKQFRLFNQAAEVLLDPEARAAYDAELAGQPAAAPVVEEAPEAEPEPITEPEPAPDPDPEPVAEPDAVTPTVSLDKAADAPVSAYTTPAGAAGWAPPGWLLIGLAVFTALLVGAAVWLWVTVPSEEQVSSSTSEAQSTAERAIVPVLSYDYRRLDADHDRAADFLAGDYRSDYDDLFEVIKENAPTLKTVVKAEVLASGIVRTNEKADRVDVLLFVDQSKTDKASKEPVVYRNQATVTMKKSGDDWRVVGLKTSPVEN